MGMFGRVIMVGNLSCYNQLQAAPSIPALDLAITLKELTIVGFNVYRSDTHEIRHCGHSGHYKYDHPTSTFQFGS